MKGKIRFLSFNKSILIFRLILVFTISGNAFSQTFTPVEGMYIGPNFIVWKAEATNSSLGLWQIVREGDSRYFEGNNLPPIGGTHLEFTGNNPAVGPAASPLVYEFVAPKTGRYRLAARMYSRLLPGEPADYCNDVYVRMEGNFTSGNSISTANLKTNQKFYGRGVKEWGVLSTLELAGHVQNSALYDLIEGENYKLIVSGRAQRTNIDYWMLYETTIPIVISTFPQKDLAYENPDDYHPLPYRCRTVNAVNMRFDGINGFADAQPEHIVDMDVLQNIEKDTWSAARFLYNGTSGNVNFVLNTILERAGESIYRVKVNGVLVGEVTNDRIHGTDIPEYTIQSHIINVEDVEINFGDIIQIEFNNTSNGLVTEDGAEVSSQGRWVSLQYCTSGFLNVYRLSFARGNYVVFKDNSTQLTLNKNFPEGFEADIVWESLDSSIASVDQNGVVTGHKLGTTTIYVSANNNFFVDSCVVNVLNSGSFHGTPAIVPGKIQAEDFDLGGQDVAYYDTTPENNQGNQYRLNEGVDIQASSQEGGFHVGWICKGEWLNYTIDVQEDGNYDFNLRVASASSNITFHLQIDGEKVSNHMVFPTSGGWHQFKTVTVENIPLKTGVQVLTVYSDEGTNTWNFHSMDIVKRAPVVLVEGISIHEESITISHIESFELNVSIFPENATNPSLVWSSSNTSVATVNSSGKVSGIAEGEAWIIARSVDGEFADTCLVTVTRHIFLAEGISIHGCSNDSLQLDETRQLSAIISPENADDKSVRWVSSDPAIATVDSVGLVTAIAPGLTVITVTSNDGDFSEYCEIVVQVEDTDSNVANKEPLARSVHVYPNPASTKLFIRLPDYSELNFMRIFSIDGRLLMESKLTDIETSVDVAPYNSLNIIIIQIITNNSSSTHKVILSE